MEEVERISREALAEVRSAVSGYRSGDLAAELSRARVALATAGVELTVSAPRLGLSPLPQEIESAVALALREAVTNVIRHARASACEVRLAAENGRLVLEVQDDGCGGGFAEGAGLAGMRERIAALGGAVERRTAGGTRLSVAVPLPPVPAAPAVPAVRTSPSPAGPFAEPAPAL
jgi:two-component system sensor histidine kinase DesK